MNANTNWKVRGKAKYPPSSVTFEISRVEHLKLLQKSVVLGVMAHSGGTAATDGPCGGGGGRGSLLTVELLRTRVRTMAMNQLQHPVKTPTPPAPQQETHLQQWQLQHRHLPPGKTWGVLCNGPLSEGGAWAWEDRERVRKKSLKGVSSREGVEERHRQGKKPPAQHRARRRPPPSRHPPTTTAAGVRPLSEGLGFELRTDTQAEGVRRGWVPCVASSSSTQGSREQRVGAMN